VVKLIGEDGRRWVRLVVYIFLERDGKILLGKRKNIFGDGHYSTPAGHIEPGETVMECAGRELFEETGIHAKGFEFICARLLKDYEINGQKAHEYVAFAVRPKKWSGEPKLTEPDKTEKWDWYPMDKLPNPMFPPVPMLLECMRKSVPFAD
jgi:8-oxo-dGTP diphosphatase